MYFPKLVKIFPYLGILISLCSYISIVNQVVKLGNIFWHLN